jgi:malate dehydrogenase
MAYAGALFADACLRGLNGEPDVEEYTFVESSVVAELPFFSSRVKLGPNGAFPCMSTGHLC